jgi:hypothetical protein
VRDHRFEETGLAIERLMKIKSPSVVFYFDKLTETGGKTFCNAQSLSIFE